VRSHDRRVDAGSDGGLLHLGRPVRRLARPRMSLADILELIVAVGLLVYLTIALIRPEKF
jgi:K+-transporting ATPase KdpF subunit